MKCAFSADAHSIRTQQTTSRGGFDPVWSFGRFRQLARDRKHEHVIRYEKLKTSRRTRGDHWITKTTTNESSRSPDGRSNGWDRLEHGRDDHVTRALINVWGQADFVVNSGWTSFSSCPSDDSYTAWCSRSARTMRAPTMPQIRHIICSLISHVATQLTRMKWPCPRSLKTSDDIFQCAFQYASTRCASNAHQMWTRL